MAECKLFEEKDYGRSQKKLGGIFCAYPLDSSNVFIVEYMLKLFYALIFMLYICTVIKYPLYFNKSIIKYYKENRI